MKIIITILILLPTLLNAQDWKSAIATQGNGVFNAIDMKLDINNNSFLLGSFSGDVQVLGQSYSSRGINDLLLFKLSKTGEFLEGVQIGGPGQDLAAGIAIEGSNVFISGSHSDSVFFSEDTLKSAGGLDCYLAKYDADLNLAWAKSIGKGPKLQQTGAISINSSGDILLSGSFQDSLIMPSDTLTGTILFTGFYSSFDTEGNLNWVHSIDGSDSGGIAFFYASRSFSDINYFSGYWKDTISINGTEFGAVGTQQDNFLFKTDQDGNILWSRSIKGSGSDIAYEISTDNQGDVYLGGVTYSDNLSIDSTETEKSNITYSRLGSGDLLLTKYNLGGTLQWNKLLGGIADDRIYALHTTADTVHFSGYFSYQFVFGNDTAESNGTLDQDAFLAGIHTDGTPLYLKGITGMGSYDDEGAAIASDDSGDILLFGSFKSPEIYPGDKTLVNETAENNTGFLASYGCLPININSETPSDIQCFGELGGVSIDADGGFSTNLLFSVDSGATYFNNGGEFNDLAAGEYDIFVKDSTGCTEQGGSFTLTEPPAIDITQVDSTNITCFGADDGTITITAIGGSDPLEYSNDGITFQAGNVFNSLTPGTYSIAVRDGNGCLLSGSDVTLTEPAVLAISTSSVSDVTCNGDGDGAVDITVVGGTAPYTYSWTGDATASTEDLSGLSGGTYNVTITDANGCSVSGSYTVSEPAVLAISTSSVSDVTCNGDGDGAVDITVVGGTAPYTYSWTGDATESTEDLSGIGGGTYDVTITDANLCTVSGSYTVSEPAVLEISSSSVFDVTCNGDGDGAVDITVVGGTAPYTYSWTGDATATTEDLSGLSGGTYNVTVTDANGCSVSGSYTVSEPAVLAISSSSVSDVTCNGDGDGAVDITVAGGTAPYTYSWTGDATASTEDLSGLSGGTYDVTITDANLCTVSGSYTVSEPVVLEISTSSVTDLSCNGDGDGAVDITVVGGTAPYTYSWTGDATATTEDLSGLSGGTYNVTVTDANGCSVNDSYTVSEPAVLEISSSSVFDVTCNGDGDGAVDITVVGGTAPYTYSWTGDATATTEDLSGLSGGTYNVTVTDANGCSVNDSYTVSEPAVLAISSSSVSDVTCNGDGDGAVDITVVGGTAPYTYSWSGDATASTEDLSGLSGGTYNVTVTDANGCSVNDSYTVSEPAVLEISSSSVFDVTCNGDGDGAVDITVVGGTAPYTYSWTGDATATTEDLSGLSGGTYNVTVTDANGCSVNDSYTVSEPAVLEISSSSVFDVTCNGDGDGAVDITVVGGTAPYTYSWTGDATATTEDLSGLSGGTYNVTVTDANGCSVNDSYTVSEPAVLEISSSSVSDVTCNGDGDGAVDITVVGGTAPYTYSWSGGATASTEDLSGLSGGTYNVTVTDANGCSVNDSYTVSEPAVLEISSSSVSDVTCNGDGDGAVDITVVGGTAPYTYSWSGDATASTEDLSGLSGGTYNVTVTDANGCSVNDSYTVSEPAVLEISSSSVSDVTCNGDGDGAVDITVVGGTAPYTYSWSGGATASTEDLSGLSGGTYNVTITDANGCSVNDSYTVSEPAVLAISSSSVSDVTCNGDGDGAVDITVVGGTAPYTYSWSGGATASTEDLSGLSGGTYNVTITDANGCSVNDSYTVSEPAVLAISSSSVSDVTCNGNSEGSLVINATGGTAPLQFSIDGGTTYQAESTFGSLTAGTYTVDVLDDNGCTISGADVTITEPDAISVTSVDITNVSTCNGDSNGSLVINATGGTAPLQFSIDGGTTYQAESTFSSLTAGTYTVDILDDNGCTFSGADVTITEPDVLSISTVDQTDITCNGANDGTITITAAGGTAPYLYAIDGSTFQSAATFTGLAPATYTIDVTDDNGCAVSGADVTITEPAVLSISTVEQTNVICKGADDGTITITAEGGTMPYQYSIDGAAFQPEATFSGLAPATYTIDVTDANGCAVSGTDVTITEPAAALTISNVLTEDVLCFGKSTGSIEISAEGGIAPLQYSIDGSNFQSGATFSGISAGNYTAEVLDANGCSVSQTDVVITETEKLVITIDSVSHIYRDSPGMIVSTAAGGTAPYTYLLLPDEIEQDSGTFVFPDVADQGIYNIQVVDANNCGPVVSSGIEINDSTSVSIHNELYWNFKLYPNPTRDIVTMEFNTELDEIFMEIITVDGKQLINKRLFSSSGLIHETLNLDRFKPGVYILRLNHDIVKERIVLE